MLCPVRERGGLPTVSLFARATRTSVASTLLLLDQIKREKGVWWMPWQQEAMKDVILCDKSWGAENRL